MNIKDWKNGRKLTDPLAFQEVKDMFYAIDPELGDNDELMEMQSIRNRNKINQAR